MHEFKEKVSHPFKDMEVGITVKSEIKYQSYVYVYGRRTGKKFITESVDGVLYVKRIA